MSERYINNLTGDFSICFSEHLTEHPIYLIIYILFHNNFYFLYINTILPLRHDESMFLSCFD